MSSDGEDCARDQAKHETDTQVPGLADAAHSIFEIRAVSHRSGGYEPGSQSPPKAVAAVSHEPHKKSKGRETQFRQAGRMRFELLGIGDTNEEVEGEGDDDEGDR